MQPHVLLLSLAATTAVQAAVTPAHQPCSAPAPSQEFLDTIQGFREAEARPSIFAAPQALVKTYVHIIAADQTIQGGYISRDTINKQMAVFNQTFAPSGFSFVLQDVDYTVNAYYADLQKGDEYSLKRSLRKGAYQDLNLYYVRSVYSRNTGWCYYPTTYTNIADTNFILDGCVINSGTMPGGNYPPFNEGKITTHETGHWLGLIHTFGENENDCNSGDYVDDTPAEFSHASGCPVGRDTCSGPGVDPINNYMDYSDNSCQTGFTQGQIARMWSNWNKFRSGK